MSKRKLICFLLLPIGIIGVLVMMLVVPLNYTPDTSVPFPYVPPPEGDEGYYTGTTARNLALSFQAQAEYSTPFDVEGNIGKSFILKDVLISTKGLTTRKVEVYDQSGKLLRYETETYLMSSCIQFIPQDLSKWQELKAGDIVDIIGVCAGTSIEWGTVIVFRNCQFFPAGVAPLPLPGGPVIIDGY